MAKKEKSDLAGLAAREAGVDVKAASSMKYPADPMCGKIVKWKDREGVSHPAVIHHVEDKHAMLLVLDNKKGVHWEKSPEGKEFLQWSA